MDTCQRLQICPINMPAILLLFVNTTECVVPNWTSPILKEAGNLCIW